MENPSQLNLRTVIQDITTTAYGKQTLNPELIDLAVQYSPSEITESIFNSPPKVKVGLTHGKIFQPMLEVVSPTNEDRKYLDIKVEKFNHLPPTPEATNTLKIALTSAQTYLASPRIKDDFLNHNDRRNWENGVSAGLRALDEHLGLTTNSQEDYEKKSYAKNFKTRWDRNKYSRSRMTGVSTAFQILYMGFGESLTDAEKEKLENLITRFDNLGIEEVIKPGIYIDKLESQTPRQREETVAEVEKMARETVDFIVGKFG